nr:hypothetical protein [Kibdelosporangium sp. MJ126-NF4]CEL17797.1 Copper binding protein, plastocyanin/azurin family [Kibdelosporangium sp. MJ126-NF4]CTQ90979.1 Copper binding protein, plastocyanin/azurin family [Kibdelosporangium sp. MJ126-NF4]
MRHLSLPAVVAAVVMLGVIPPAAAAAPAQVPTAQVPAAQPKTEVLKQRQLASGETESVIRFGPIIAQPNDGGGHAHAATPKHGPHEPDHGKHTMVVGALIPPCVNCYLTSVTPNLTYKDGQSANYDTGVILHHAVVFDRSKEDPTCGNGQSLLGLGGQRIFATGNERTAGVVPDGYGVSLGQIPLTWTLVELMNTSSSWQPVYVDYTVTHVPNSKPGMKPITVVWMDKANCRNSQHNAPKGESHFTWQWKSNLSGTVKTVGGHLHDGGQIISTSNKTTGQTFCDMPAGYDNKPAYQGHIDTLPTCSGADLGKIRKGDVLELNSTYHTHFADPAVMSIALLYVAENE